MTLCGVCLGGGKYKVTIYTQLKFHLASVQAAAGSSGYLLINHGLIIADN